MERHGSETYFVVGEGLLGESVGGREPRLAATAAAPAFRFSRMGPKGTAGSWARRNRKKIGSPMAAGGGRPSQIPAGFTYLGQFTDHDLTFDKTNVMLGENVSPAAAPAGALAEPRPRLPLRRRPRRSRVGEVLRGRRPSPEGGKDGRGRRRPGPGRLRPPARRGHHATRRSARRSSPIPGNDENLAVAQTHLAFIRFHNRVVDTLPASCRRARVRARPAGSSPSTTSGCSAPTTCRGSARPASSTTSSRTAARRSRSGCRRPRCRRCRSSSPSPLSGSATRWSAPPTTGTRSSTTAAGTLEYLFEFSALSGDLGGEPRLPSTWIADFRRLYDFGEAGRARPRGAGEQVQPRDADRHHRSSNPLGDLPRARSAARRCRTTRTNLAFRNLTRANMVKLATGQQMATFLTGKGVTLTKLTSAQIRDGKRRRRARRAHRAAARGACSRTRRCGSTSCARPSSTAAS